MPSFASPSGNVSGARGILKTFDTKVPGHALVKLRRIGLEVRHRNLQLAEALLAESVADAKSPEARGFYSWRYARFAAKVLGDVDKASEVMVLAISQDKVGSKTCTSILVVYYCLSLGYTYTYIGSHPLGKPSPLLAVA